MTASAPIPATPAATVDYGITTRDLNLWYARFQALINVTVNIKKGIHCLNPKNPKDKEDMERPTKETARYYVSHAKDPNLNKAMDDASRAMIRFLEEKKGIARLDAYGLASVAMDCRVGDVWGAEKNVHCLIPKSIWQSAKR